MFNPSIPTVYLVYGYSYKYGPESLPVLCREGQDQTWTPYLLINSACKPIKFELRVGIFSLPELFGSVREERYV
jgi:hypothetical protein